MWCPKCGKQISDSSKFCPKCGTQIQGVHKPKADEERKNKKSHAALYVIISVIVLLLAIGCGFAFYQLVLSDKESTFFDKNPRSGNEDIIETEEITEETTEETTEESAQEMESKTEMGTSMALETPTAPETMAAVLPTVPVESEHTYRLVVKDCTWTEAYQEAISLGGSLVSINTEEEYDKIKNLITASGLTNVKFWIGGMRNTGSYEYHWIDKNGTLGMETLNSGDYSSLWMVNEPSFQDGTVEENYMNIFYYNKENRWVWNDVPNDIIAVVPTYSGSVGYICEFE